MKRIGSVLILAALAGSGCTPSMVFFQGDKKPPKVEMKPPAPPPSVTPDTVTEANAAEKAKALREELEHEMRHKTVSEPDQ